MNNAIKALLRRRNLGLLLVVALVLGTSAAAIGGVPHQTDSNNVYKYFGDASDAVDPNDADNDVVRFDTATNPDTAVGMGRKMSEKVAAATDQIELKYLFTGGRTNCDGGSPRVDLFIDTDGDKQIDNVLRGYVQDLGSPNGHCTAEKWTFVDLANRDDATPHWAIGNGNSYLPWSAIEAQFGTATILYGQLIDDAQSFNSAARGTSYFDLVSIGNRTFVKQDDAN
jgi:hypothetical protein